MLIHDFFYVVEVYGESRKPHSPGTIERRLWSCVRDVKRRLASGERAKPIGILSTDNRDQWAEVRSLLVARSFSNKFEWFRTTIGYAACPQSMGGPWIPYTTL